ncbi:hypothetical protein ABZP36_010597 [Zizania latifolia]
MPWSISNSSNSSSSSSRSILAASAAASAFVADPAALGRRIRTHWGGGSDGSGAERSPGGAEAVDPVTLGRRDDPAALGWRAGAVGSQAQGDLAAL